MGSSYKVVFTKEALKYFEKLDRHLQLRVARVIEWGHLQISELTDFLSTKFHFTLLSFDIFVHPH